ncbi:Lrp/AsnC family transcriptional regulator [Brooklawnia cerclae]|uniref:Lrp/AsnC family leucine-responsive transcriptional regulator n=1 Tax=Brooklawnia cerclae TaxID=349934 RepID=A0ABX0SAW2_9ACTN|nr:Lrp/AsnC family transcriptional regulator [Brooklawnia cerclae]NIH55464.1 Lrp/AsnC family leucine-responsive transcriptional regulator [Brooklawnia cerclae]
MDALDGEILTILRTDGRASFSDIGRRVGLSTNATAARVHRLERLGIILSYRAVLAEDEPDPVAGLEAFIDVRLRLDQDSEDFLAWTGRNTQIQDAVHVTGAYDYLLHVRVPDTATLDRLLRRLKNEAGAAQTQTSLALRPGARTA